MLDLKLFWILTSVIINNMLIFNLKNDSIFIFQLFYNWGFLKNPSKEHWILGFAYRSNKNKNVYKKEDLIIKGKIKFLSNLNLSLS